MNWCLEFLNTLYNYDKKVNPMQQIIYLGLGQLLENIAWKQLPEHIVRTVNYSNGEILEW